jgi:hypothetical protein
MVRIAAALAALSAGFAPATASHGAGVNGGLFGVVTRGPISPMCLAEQPCSEPASGAVLVFSRDGAVVARVTARPNGTYRVRLGAGLYAVRCSVRRLAPKAVRVRPGTMRRVDFSIDTGIR